MNPRPERIFKNALSLCLVLLGLAFLALSIGGLVQFFIDLAYQRLVDESATQLAYRGVTLLVTLCYFWCGIALVRTRPRYQRSPEHGTTRVREAWNAFGLASAIRALSVAVLLLGALLLFDIGSYARDTSLAAVLLICGGFGFIATTLWRRSDPNVAAVGAIFAAIAGGLLLYAQLYLPYVSSAPGDYGAWEIANLVLPRWFAPAAIIIASIGALAYAYARAARFGFLAFLLVGLGALAYGIGIVISGAAGVLGTPWGNFSNADGETLVRLLSLTAGAVLLCVGGLAMVAACLSGFVRNGYFWRASRPVEHPALPSTVWGPAETPDKVVVRTPTIIRDRNESVIVDAPTVVRVEDTRTRRRTRGGAHV